MSEVEYRVEVRTESEQDFDDLRAWLDDRGEIPYWASITRYELAPPPRPKRRWFWRNLGEKVATA